MARKTVTVRRPGFEARERFRSEADAQAWREMVETTLDHREKVKFDLALYAAGLADSVRTHGGLYTKAKWLSVEVPQEQWVKGLPINETDVPLPAPTLKPPKAHGPKE